MFIEFGESGALEQGARYLLHGILLPLDGYEEALKLVEWIRPTLTSRVLAAARTTIPASARLCTGVFVMWIAFVPGFSCDQPWGDTDARSRFLETFPATLDPVAGRYGVRCGCHPRTTRSRQ